MPTGVKQRSPGCVFERDIHCAEAVFAAQVMNTIHFVSALMTLRRDLTFYTRTRAVSTALIAWHGCSQQRMLP